MLAARQTGRTYVATALLAGLLIRPAEAPTSRPDNAWPTAGGAA
jgi:hypothetical protein